MRELTEDNITDAVLKAIEGTADPRFKQVMTSLIRHLHGFVREVELTTGEWAAAMDFLYRAGQISTPVRHEFILASDTLGVSSLVDIINNRKKTGVTETSVLGPFYIEGSPELPVGADLIRDNEGEPAVIEGRVTDRDGAPIEGALLDVWQTAANRLYSNQDPNQDDYNLRCKMRTGADGRYMFTTVTPVSYKVPDDGPVGDMLRGTDRHAWRPAHLHFKVSADGYRPLVTELFVGDDEYIDEDAVFGVRETLAVPFAKVDSADEAAKYGLKAPFRRVDFDFGLDPVG